uniref:Uncharacterized protein n=1 Tax=Anguilla anguilla TaxID=7936 RepID=A0A0E9QKS3_ANGAN
MNVSECAEALCPQTPAQSLTLFPSYCIQAWFD